IIGKIHDTVVAALGQPEIREKLATQFMEPIPTTPARFRAKIEADLARWSPVIKALDLKINWNARSLRFSPSARESCRGTCPWERYATGDRPPSTLIAVPVI